MYRTLIIEDDLDVAEILKDSFLAIGIECVYSDTVASGIEKLQSYKPHLVILDIVLPNGNGQLLLQHIESSQHKPIVLAITGNEGVSGAEIFNLNAHGFFRKPFDFAELTAAARRFLLSTFPDIEFLKTLTAREIEVLKLLSQGHSSRVIGKELNISSRTVEQHRNNLRRKLNAKNTAELIQKGHVLCG